MKNFNQYTQKNPKIAKALLVGSLLLGACAQEDLANQPTERTLINSLHAYGHFDNTTQVTEVGLEQEADGALSIFGTWETSDGRVIELCRFTSQVALSEIELGDHFEDKGLVTLVATDEEARNVTIGRNLRTQTEQRGLEPSLDLSIEGVDDDHSIGSDPQGIHFVGDCDNYQG